MHSVQIYALEDGSFRLVVDGVEDDENLWKIIRTIQGEKIERSKGNEVLKNGNKHHSNGRRVCKRPSSDEREPVSFEEFIKGFKLQKNNASIKLKLGILAIYYQLAILGREFVKANQVCRMISGLGAFSTIEVTSSNFFSWGRYLERIGHGNYRLNEEGVAYIKKIPRRCSDFSEIAQMAASDLQRAADNLEASKIDLDGLADHDRKTTPSKMKKRKNKD